MPDLLKDTPESFLTNLLDLVTITQEPAFLWVSPHLNAEAAQLLIIGEMTC
jgi:hypothetical protein